MSATATKGRKAETTAPDLLATAPGLELPPGWVWAEDAAARLGCTPATLVALAGARFEVDRAGLHESHRAFNPICNRYWEADVARAEAILADFRAETDTAADWIAAKQLVTPNPLAVIHRPDGILDAYRAIGCRFRDIRPGWLAVERQINAADAIILGGDPGNLGRGVKVYLGIWRRLRKTHPYSQDRPPRADFRTTPKIEPEPHVPGRWGKRPGGGPYAEPVWITPAEDAAFRAECLRRHKAEDASRERQRERDARMAGAFVTRQQALSHG